MGEGTYSPIIGPVLMLVFASVALAGLVIYLGRSGRLASPGLRLAAAILPLLPLFGGGVFMYLHRIEMRVTDQTAPGVNGIHPDGVDATTAQR